jgi:hypothetical protein
VYTLNLGLVHARQRDEYRLQYRRNAMGSSSELDALKDEVVTGLFVDTADQDYVLARLAYHKKLYNGFFWGAGQAIEKYLKASLLLNGLSSKPYGHDLMKLFKAVTLYAADLLPEKLTQPEQLDGVHWQEETPTEFLNRVQDYVSPDNRYNIFGYVVSCVDLCHLDQLVFALRRLTFKLDAYPFLGEPNVEEGAPSTVRKMLVLSPTYSPRGPGSRLWKLTSEKSDDELRHAALKLNFPFASDEYRDQPRAELNRKFAWSRSVFRLSVFQPLKQKPEASIDADAAALADWVVHNIVLPRDVQQELKDAAAKLRSRI